MSVIGYQRTQGKSLMAMLEFGVSRVETKFTPGPWTAFVDRSDDGDVFTIMPAMREGQIALVTGENASADCSLIAAAPQLYEALKKMTARYVELVNSGDAGYWNPELDDQVIAARAALASARSEEGKG